MNWGIIIIIILSIAGFTFALLTHFRWKKISKDIYIDDKIVSKRRRYRNFTIAGVLLTFSSVLFLTNYYTVDNTIIDLWIDASWSIGYVAFLLDAYYKVTIVDSIGELCLYLRPFGLDSPTIIKDKKGFIRGSMIIKEPIEKLFCDRFNQKISQTFSIGNPSSSVSSTYSTTNLYANDSEWKDVIKELTRKAEVIIIRVGDSEGCLWELNHCVENHYLLKTIFLIENESMLNSIRSRIEQIGPINFHIDQDTKFIHAVYFDKRLKQWLAIELRSKRIIKKFVAKYIDSDDHLKEHALTQKKRDNIFKTFFKPGKVPGRLWQTLGFMLNPIGYGIYNRWTIKWWALFIANAALAFFSAFIIYFLASIFIYSYIIYGELYVEFENLTEIEKANAFEQLLDSDWFFDDLYNSATMMTIPLMAPWIWLAPNVSWRCNKWGSELVFVDRNRSFTTWTVLFLLFFFLCFLII